MPTIADTPRQTNTLTVRGAIGVRVHHITPTQARALRRAAETSPGVLPRRHPGEGANGWHTLAQPGAYSRVLAWRDRWHWLNIVVPLALSHERGRAALSRHHVSRDTFRRWARIESLFAADRATGRRVIVRPDDVARLGELGCERTVQRCRAAARELGLLVDVSRGRHLRAAELRHARQRGAYSRQMGLCNESACAVPRWMPPLAWLVARSRAAAAGGHVTPSEGRARRAENLTVTGGSIGAYGGRGAKRMEPAPPAPAPTSEDRPPGRPPRAAGDPLRRSQRRSWALARDLVRSVPWLAAEAPGRLVPALTRFANARPRWTAADVVTAIDVKNARMGWSSPAAAGIRTRPAVLLARAYLADFDPQADHPRLELRAAADAAPAWCGRCDRATRQRDTDDGRRRRCPTCHPLAKGSR